jgi:hypothetical protein
MAAFETGADIIITPAINQQKKWGESVLIA